MSERFKPDANSKSAGVVGGYSSADAVDAQSPTLLVIRIDPVTSRLLVDSNAGGDLVEDGDAYAAGTDGTVMFGTDGSNYFPLLTDDTGALQITATLTETEDDDDDSIAGGQTLPLKIVENYFYDKTGPGWTRAQSSSDGYLFTRPIGVFDSAGHELDISATGIVTVDLGANNDVTLATLPDTAAGDLAALSGGQLPDGHAVTIDNIISNEVYVRGSGTAGSADAAVLTIQGIASMTPLAVTESAPLTGFATSTGQLADGHNVTIDNAGAGAAVNIQDGGNAITVDGTVTANLGAVDNAVLDNIALYTAGSETALEKIDGALVGTGEPTIDSYAHIAINLGVVTDSVLVASAANKQIWVYGFGITCSVAGTVSFQDEDNTAITGIMDFAANSGMAVPSSGNFAMPIWKLATNKDLEVDTVTCSIDGWLSYAIVSV